jgi:hypothetical protein
MKKLTKDELGEEIALLRLEVQSLRQELTRVDDLQAKMLDKLAFYTACALAGVSPEDETQHSQGFKDKILISVTGEMPF